MPVPAKILRKNKPIEILPDGTKVWARNEAGKPVCNARRNSEEGKRLKKRCQSTMVLPLTGRCLRHGGKTRRGVTHQRFKHGKYSAAIPKSIREEFHRYLSDPDYLSLREDIAITKVRLQNILTGLENAVDAVTVRKLYSLARKMKTAMQCEDIVAEANELRKLCMVFCGLIDQGRDSVAYGRQLETSQTHLRNLIETERKRVESGYRQINVEVVMTLVMQMMGTLAEVVTDTKQLTRVATSWDRMLQLQQLPGLPEGFIAEDEGPIIEQGERFPDYPPDEEDE
jgi:hypothetical protein